MTEFDLPPQAPGPDEYRQPAEEFGQTPRETDDASLVGGMLLRELRGAYNEVLLPLVDSGEMTSDGVTSDLERRLRRVRDMRPDPSEAPGEPTINE